ncbi:hypothetical protein IC614_02070 [Allosphingosinicella flava]|uniref:Transporter n=1 Tax=Allosphingosinicella flava TaxID=2771430 RepID=A0A7T2LMB6_9SPHN|nr:hypothetical protein [Sphingosinicella flava]QPQ55420.1 hypothetical protein IC614_02070 [Sphingosinicella flava]
MLNRIARNVLLLASVALPSGAWAQGFVMERGEGRVIVTGIYSHSSKQFDDDGDVIDIMDYRQAQIYLNGEYGLTDDLTLLLTPSFRDISIDDRPERDETGFQFVDIGARYRVAHIGNTHFSVQAKVRIPADTFRDELAQVSIEGTAYDFRGQIGHGFQMGGKDAFIIGDAGYTVREDDPPNEIHADVIFGYRPAPRVLLLANLYNTFSDGEGRNGFPDYRYHNLFLSGVYDINDTVSLHLGGLMTVDGENALRERGLLLGAWLHF